KEHEYFIDLEIEEYLDQESEAFIEREPFTLETILVINQNETKVIKNKIINLSSIITVKGRLQFENCEININDNFVPISLQSGTLEFINCHVNAISNKEFLIESDNICEISIINSNFKTTTAICNDKNNLIISNCNIESNAKTLVFCNNLNIINSEIKGLLYIESDPNYLIGIKTEGEIIKLENTNLINIEFQTTNTCIIDNCIFEHYCGFNTGGDGQISNTKFKSLKGDIIFGDLKITNCEVNSNKTNFCKLSAFNCTIEDT